MDLNLMKKKLNEFSKKAPSSQKFDYEGWKENFWIPPVGKSIVRIVPYKFNKSNPFVEMLVYYGIGGKTIYSPQNWDEKDPIAEFAKELWKSSDKKDWDLAKKLSPKLRAFAPIIVRGEEEKGVRWWQFGKEIYESFINMANDEEIGEYDDVYEGRDIKLTTVGPEVTGKKFNKTTISPSLKVTPLHSDSTMVEAFLENQKDLKKLYKPLPFDKIKELLQTWLTPEDEDEEEITSEAHDGFEDEVEEPKSRYSLNVKPKSKIDQFNDLFNDEDDEDDEDEKEETSPFTVGGDDDDLPF